jgi:maleylacetate reductase
MDGGTVAAHQAAEDEQRGPLPAGMRDVLVGEPHAKLVVREALSCGFSRVFILANSSLRGVAMDLQRRLQAQLEAATAQACFSVQMGGGDDGVLQACDLAARMGADCVVSLGGGAVQDAAKIVRLWLSVDGASSTAASTSALQAAEARSPMPVLLPQIACPSVFAMAELTAMAGMSSGGRKVGLNHPSMMPTLVCFDPALTSGCPDWLLYGTALRAVDHCIEAATSSRASEATRVLALKGLGLVQRGLAGMLDDRNSAAAQADVYYGGWNGILAMLNVGYAAGHFLENQFSARFAVHQGACSALIMAPMLRWHAEVTAPQQGRIAEVLAPTVVLADRPSAADLVQQMVDSVAERAGIPSTLDEISNATPEALRLWSADVFAQHAATLNVICPREFGSALELLSLVTAPPPLPLGAEPARRTGASL